MKIVFLLSFLSLSLISCEIGRFRNVETLNQKYTYQIEKRGEFSEVSEKRANDIALDILDLNLGSDEGFLVTKVNVRGVNVEFLYSAGNTATEIDLGLLVTDRVGNVEETFFNTFGQFKIPLAGTEWQQQLKSEFELNEKLLRPAGIIVIKRALEEILLNTYTFDQDGLIITLNGNVPDGKVFSGNIIVSFIIDIEYQTCEEVPFGVAAETCI